MKQGKIAGLGFHFLLVGSIAGIFTPSSALRAQSPTIKVDGKESGLVYLKKLAVDVHINGIEATTTWTMTIQNKTGRILEGELNFPLGQGVSVSKYALDINGRLREAVPVEKQKATLVFEKVERRRVDPGLLEKVEGNSFRTRVYPIPANGTRTVVIGYQEELPWTGGRALRYRLPLAFNKPVEEFRIDIHVLGGSIKPEVEENAEGQLHFDEWQNSWSASHEWTDFKADHSVIIRMPKAPQSEEVQMQQSGNHYYYVVNTFPTGKKIEKKLPGRITILWDASLSGLSRNTEKEFGLLDGYFKKLNKSVVQLVTFSNTVQNTRSFEIDHGNWAELRSVLQTTVYDGATQFGALDLGKYPCDEFLLFSDGKSNFGSDAIGFGQVPVYAIASSAGSDFPFLQYVARKSGGELLNLENTDLSKALEQLTFQPLRFLGVRSSPQLEENYPSLSQPVADGLSVAGISYQPKNRVVLQFGYGNKVIREQEVELDFSRQQTNQLNLARIWAQKKLAELDTRFEDNKDEIGRLGRRYGLVTRNTSLIVLENVMDYVTYDIAPPAELQAEYDRIMKDRAQSLGANRRKTTEDAEVYLDELLKWWKEDPAIRRKEGRDGGIVADHAVDGNRASFVRQDTVQYRPPSMNLSSGLVGSVSGVQVQESRDILRKAAPATADLQEVAVTGYAASRKNDPTGSVMTLNDGYVNESSHRGGGGDGGGRGDGGDRGDRGIFTALKAEPNTEYLARIKGVAPNRRYALYLELRKEHFSTPLFYFHMADFFYSAGDKTIAERILSNIAELDAESYELYKLLGYKLKEWGNTGEACAVFRKVLEWRPFEPQSYRDYGLALEDAGQYQRALDTLYTALVKNYDADLAALYPGIEETILPEINNLIARQGEKLDYHQIPKSLVENMPVDIRVVLNWNMNATDIDLWVTDPEGEKCYYGHRTTALGGRISHDFTQGLGPEQFLLKKAAKGSYKVEVNYYGDHQVKLAGPTTVMVEVYTNYGSPRQKRQIMTMQMLPGTSGAVAIGEFDFR
jgi:hypothetical protein